MRIRRALAGGTAQLLECLLGLLRTGQVIWRPAEPEHGLDDLILDASALRATLVEVVENGAPDLELDVALVDVATEGGRRHPGRREELEQAALVVVPTVPCRLR
jgi:hypothetical protein